MRAIILAAVTITAMLLLPTIAAAQQDTSCTNSQACSEKFGSGYICRQKECVCAFGSFEVSIPAFNEAGQTVCDVAQEYGSLVNLAVVLARILLAATISISLIIIVIAGYVYMTAGGNTNQVGKAKNMIAMAIAGIVIALTAFAVLNFISPQFAGNLRDPIGTPSRQ